MVRRTVVLLIALDPPHVSSLGTLGSSAPVMASQQRIEHNREGNGSENANRNRHHRVRDTKAVAERPNDRRRKGRRTGCARVEKSEGPGPGPRRDQLGDGPVEQGRCTVEANSDNGKQEEGGVKGDGKQGENDGGSVGLG